TPFSTVTTTAPYAAVEQKQDWRKVNEYTSASRVCHRARARSSASRRSPHSSPSNMLQPDDASGASSRRTDGNRERGRRMRSSPVERVLTGERPGGREKGQPCPRARHGHGR